MKKGLASTLLHLVNIESVSGHEEELTDWFVREMAAAGVPGRRAPDETDVAQRACTDEAG